MKQEIQVQIQITTNDNTLYQENITFNVISLPQVFERIQQFTAPFENFKAQRESNQLYAKVKQAIGQNSDSPV